MKSFIPRMAGGFLATLKNRGHLGLAGLLLLMTIATAWWDVSFAGTTSGPQASPVSGFMDQIFNEPQKYQGREVTLEGTLLAEGRGVAVAFYLRGDSGARLEVDAWVPLAVPPPPPGKGRPPVKIMADYEGRRLRLTGRLQDRGGRIILRVSSVEELP